MSYWGYRRYQQLFFSLSQIGMHYVLHTCFGIRYLDAVSIPTVTRVLYIQYHDRVFEFQVYRHAPLAQSRLPHVNKFTRWTSWCKASDAADQLYTAAHWQPNTESNTYVWRIVRSIQDAVQNHCGHCASLLCQLHVRQSYDKIGT